MENSEKTRYIYMLFGQFEIQLRNAGLSCMLDELIEVWQALLAYATSYLNPTGQSYSRIWYKILNSSRKSEWCNILLLVELLFCLSVSNAVVERQFSMMKRLKTRLRSSIGQFRLCHLIRIKMGDLAWLNSMVQLPLSYGLLKALVVRIENGIIQKM